MLKRFGYLDVSRLGRQVGNWLEENLDIAERSVRELLGSYIDSKDLRVVVSDHAQISDESVVGWVLLPPWRGLISVFQILVNKNFSKDHPF